MDIGKLTALQIRILEEPERYGDGEGLTLVLTGPQKGYWVLCSTMKDRRCSIQREIDPIA